MGKEIIEFEQHIERGCGMDVHKETVVATVSGQGIKTETQTFSTITSSLKSMAQWLKKNGIPTLQWKAREYIGSLFIMFWRKILRYCWLMPDI